MEIWKDIKGYEGLYKVSRDGQVLGVKRNKILSITYTPYGTVTLCKNNIKTIGLVHRLVGIAFLENPEDKTQVNHKFGNKKDNRASQLEWNTPTENCTHAYRTGLSKVSDKCKTALSKTHSGAAHYNSKKVINHQTNIVYDTIRQAAVANKIPVQSLHRWLHQKTNSNFSFINN